MTFLATLVGVNIYNDNIPGIVGCLFGFVLVFMGTVDDIQRQRQFEAMERKIRDTKSAIEENERQIKEGAQ